MKDTLVSSETANVDQNTDKAGYSLYSFMKSVIEKLNFTDFKASENCHGHPTLATHTAEF